MFKIRRTAGGCEGEFLIPQPGAGGKALGTSRGTKGARDVPVAAPLSQEDVLWQTSRSPTSTASSAHPQTHLLLPTGRAVGIKSELQRLGLCHPGFHSSPTAICSFTAHEMAAFVLPRESWDLSEGSWSPGGDAHTTAGPQVQD